MRAIRIIRESVGIAPDLLALERDDLIRLVAARIIEAQGQATPERLAACEHRLKSIPKMPGYADETLASFSLELLQSFQPGSVHREIDMNRVLDLLSD